MSIETARSAALLSVGHAVPPNRLLQSDAAAAARRIFAHRYAAFERMAPVFGTAGIRTRQTVMPMEWYLQPRLAGAHRRLSGRRADCSSRPPSRALADAGCRPRRRHHRHRLLDRHRHAQPGGPGAGRWASAPTSCACPCSASAAPAASRAWRWPPPGARAAGRERAGGGVELCSLAFRMDQLTKANMVATALFGDGAAACVLRAGEDGFARVEGAGEHTWPDTLDIMGWSVDPTGLGVIFDRAIPPFAGSISAPPSTGCWRARPRACVVDRFICHPGGAKVIEALEARCARAGRARPRARRAGGLRQHVGADRAVRARPLATQGLPRRTVLTALGPGFTSSTVTLAGGVMVLRGPSWPW